MSVTTRTLIEYGQEQAEARKKRHKQIDNPSAWFWWGYSWSRGRLRGS